MALGIASGAGVRVYASGARWRPTGSGLDCGCAEQVPVEKLAKEHFSLRVADFV